MTVRARDSPRLTDAALGRALDGMLRRGLLRLLSRRIRGRQEALKRLASPEAWQAYLLLEELTNARLDAAMVRAARWGHRFATVGRRRT
jgi:hypothetical protein